MRGGTDIMPEKGFKADIIIPVYKPGELFIKQIGILKENAADIERIIIINTEESLMEKAVLDATDKADRTEDSPLFGKIDLIHIKKEDFDHAATRRLGVSLSKAEFFVFMTDDAIPEADTIYELLQPFKDEKVAMSYARQLARDDCREAERFTRSFNYPDESRIKTEKDVERLGIKAFFASDVCCAYRRSVYDSLGGLVEHAVFNEDMIYARKVLKNGYAISYSAKARVIHSHNYGPAAQLHRNFDLGLSQAEHPEVFSGIRSEGEGIRLVRSTAVHLIKTGHMAGLFGLFISSASKYAGYLLGKNYRKLPKRLVRLLSGNKTYIDKYINAKR